MVENLGLAIETEAGADAVPLRLAVTDPVALGAFCSRVLGPLANEKHSELRKTLDEYIRSHGSQSSVSRNLYLHRNTVRQRLRRIEELTGADLDDPEERLMLQLALLGHAELERTRRSA